uniref:Uncharacterized protein n=1 Tax=Romanomermis culicivorax TaxID=13658 RepID=A0A915HWQ2_ROMCU
MLSDIEESFDSFIIIQPIEEHISCQESVADLDTNIDKERSCPIISKATKQQINSETRMRRFNRFFASIFRRSNLEEQGQRPIGSRIISKSSASPSRETPVKDGNDLLQVSDDNAVDKIESATSIPVPMAIDATEDFFDDFRKRLTLSHIHDLCSGQSSRSAATDPTTAGPSTSTNNHGESKSRVSDGQNSLDNQTPSTSARAEQSDQASTNISDFIVIPEEKLPPVEYIGGGNPFMLFVGLAIINIYRKRFSNNRELRILFDRWILPYNYAKVIRKARRMYAKYLKSVGY